MEELRRHRPSVALQMSEQQLFREAFRQLLNPHKETRQWYVASTMNFLCTPTEF